MLTAKHMNNNMKRNYTTPQMRVVDIEVNDGLLVDTSQGSAVGGQGTEIKGEINFDEMKGTDIVRKNPWDDQW